MKQGTIRYCLVAFPALATLGVVVGLVLLAPLMAPIRRGTSEHLWYAACGVNLAQEKLELYGRKAVLRDGWFIYELGHLHGSFLFRVRESEAMLDFPLVL